ncbi:hypothetical protein Hte_004454 [Hypoxylon texense]
MSESPIEFDQHGDLKLRVGPPNETTSNTFLVCSRSLARISPVFDRMLYGSFNEAKDSNPEDWTVDLPEDDPASLAIIIRIAHGHFSEVPKILAIDRLYTLTTLTHYYDATKILVPWVDGWLASIEDILRDSNQLMPKFLWISWELGRKSLFRSTARRILTEAPASLLDSYPPSQELRMPPDIMEIIIEIRIRTIQAFLDVFQDMVDKLLVVDETPRWCRHATFMGHHRCESMILGSMTFCLARAGLWPLPDVSEVEESVVELYTKLMNIVIHDIGRPSPKSTEDHTGCNPMQHLMEHMKGIINGIADPVTDAHWRHLEIQERKLNP